MSLIERVKTSLASDTFPINTSNFKDNVLGPLDDTLKKSFDKIESTNLNLPISINNDLPGTLTVGDAIFAQPSNASFNFTLEQDKQLELSFTGNFLFSAGTANPGEFKFVVSGPAPYEKTFAIPYISSSYTQTLSFEVLTTQLDAGEYTVSFEFRNTDNAGASLTLNTGSEFFAIEKRNKYVPVTITGNVQNFSFTPLSGVTVSYNTISTTTDLNGDYVLADVPNYKVLPVTFTATGYKTQIKYINTTTITPTLDATMLSFTVSGVVKGYRGLNLNNASVEILELSLTTSTDNQGYFELENILPGTYNLIITHDNHATKTIILNVSGDLSLVTTLVPNKVSGLITSSLTGSVASDLRYTIAGVTDITNGAGEYAISNITQGTQEFVTLDDPRYEESTANHTISPGETFINKQVVPKAVPLGVKGIFPPNYTTSVNKTYSNRFTVNKNMLFTGWRVAFITNTPSYVNVRLRLWDNTGTLLTSTTSYYLQDNLNAPGGYYKDIMAPSTINLISGQSYSVGLYLETNTGGLVPIEKPNNTPGTYLSELVYIRKDVTFVAPSYFNNSDAYPVTPMPNNGIVYIDALVKL